MRVAFWVYIMREVQHVYSIIKKVLEVPQMKELAGEVSITAAEDCVNQM